MPRLHKIRFTHHAPKDRKEGIETYVLADSETTIRDGVDHQFNYDIWREGDHDEPIDIYNDDYEVVGQETRTERALRLRGSIDDDNNDYADAYYGITHHGWDEGVQITDEDAAVLLRLGIAEDWRELGPVDTPART